MDSFIDFLNNLLPFLYIITFGAYYFDFMKEGKRRFEFARLILFTTLLVHLIYLLSRTAEFSHPPITNVFEIFTVLAFSVSFSYFILELATDIRGTGAFIIIISLIFQIISSIFIEDLVEVREVLKNNLLGSHVFTALLGYAGFTISAVYGFLYLILYKDIKLSRFGLVFNKLPSLEVLEKLSFYSAIIGFVLLTIAMTIGVIWLPKAFPDFSYSDPKLISSFIVWLLYGLGIISKSLGKWRGKKVVVLSIIGFVMAIISTMLSNFLAKSFHSFY